MKYRMNHGEQMTFFLQKKLRPDETEESTETPQSGQKKAPKEGHLGQDIN